MHEVFSVKIGIIAKSDRPDFISNLKEIIQWLDGDVPFSYPSTEAVDTLEKIVAFNTSHHPHAAWTSLPLQEK